MERSAVLHIPMSEYAFGMAENKVVIRLRTKAKDLTGVKLYFGDRAAMENPVPFTSMPMELAHRTKYYDYYEAVLIDSYKRICYAFELQANEEIVYYYGDTFSEELSEDRADYFQLPFNHRADIVTPPQWAKDTIIYNIFPDSFATSKEYISEKGLELTHKGETTKSMLGGTIKGITENVDYLKKLGVNGIYINPIFAAGAYHKYDLIDYYTIDPCFGTDEEFKELVETYHANGMKVIIDGVFNHCGWKFFAFKDVVEKQENSQYKDWFYGLNFPVVPPTKHGQLPNYDCFAYVGNMPKLNLANKEAKEYFVNVGKYWIEKYDLDGWRLDVANEINDSFWREFNAAVKSVKKDAILIGEVWETAKHFCDGTIFDSAMNYDFRKHSSLFFAKEKIDGAEFGERVTNMYLRYRTQTTFAQLNLLDSHDVSRFLSVCGEDIEKYKMAVLFQMTFPGMPSIFYGDEKGMVGVEENEYRHPMIWDGKEDDLLLYYRQLIDYRKSEAVLRHGDFKVVYAPEGKKQFVFARNLGDEQVLVCFNMDDEPMDISACAHGGKVVFSQGLTYDKLQKKGFALIKK